MNFFLWRNSPGTVDSIKFLECGLSPDTEASDVTTRSNFQQIQAVDVDQRDAGYVAEGSTDTVVLRIDDYWTTALNTSAVSHFANASTETSWILHLYACRVVYIKWSSSSIDKQSNIINNAEVTAIIATYTLVYQRHFSKQYILCSCAKTTSLV